MTLTQRLKTWACNWFGVDKWGVPKTQFELDADEEKRFQKLLDKKRRDHAFAVRNAIAASQDQSRDTGKVVIPKFPLQPYIPPSGIAPAGAVMAMDKAWANLTQDDAFSFTLMSGITATVIDGMGFPGFPYLTELTQLTEYRDMSERTAAEMTRKWIKLRSASGEDKTDVIKKIDAAMNKFHVRDLFRRAAELDGQMGRCQIFVNLGDTEGPELEKKLMLHRAKIKKGSLKGFKIVEPITTYPADYNASNPLAPNYYTPNMWFVYGQKVHSTRLLNFVSRPLPDLLKPVYNFSGMSLSQLGQPYVDYWLGTRDSVGKLLKNFSIVNLESDLDTLLGKQGDELINRMGLFTANRDNQGVFLTNKDKEKLNLYTVSLSGLDKLQAQAQEHMAAVAKTPLVILLGITPTGLNASAEGDIRVYHDYIADQQEVLYRKNLEVVIKIIQLNEFGVIDEDVTFDFAPLFALNGKEQAMVQKTNAESAQIYASLGSISPEEIRGKLASDPDSGFNNIDMDKKIAPPAVPSKPDDKEAKSNQASEVAEENAADIALAVMNDATQLIADGGFRGNQHLGGFANGDDPSSQAIRLSAAATVASQEAKKGKTKRAHTAAFNAHSRALAAHQRALSSADDSMKHVHSAYIDAHQAACAAHQLGEAQ